MGRNTLGMGASPCRCICKESSWTIL